jgi:prevent-host-death family protein
MGQLVSVAEMKSHFSEYVAKTAYTHQAYIITKRNKPLAALVDLKMLSQSISCRETGGLAAMIGKWKNFDEIAPHVDRAYKNRKRDRMRHVSL